MKISRREGSYERVSHEVFFLSFPLPLDSSEEDARCQVHSSFRAEWEGRISGGPRGKSPRRTAKLCGGIYQRPDTNQRGFVYKTKISRVVGAGDAAEQTDTRIRSLASISFSPGKYSPSFSHATSTIYYKEIIPGKMSHLVKNVLCQFRSLHENTRSSPCRQYA